MQDITKEKENSNVNEQITQPEKIEEKPADIGIEKKPEIPSTQKITPPSSLDEKKEQVPPSAAAIPAAPIAKGETIEKIEDVLEEDLEDIYFKMPPEKQAEFRKSGEETATKINLLLSQAKIKVKKILDLIRGWLKIIPGINKYFLEQEAKIKTDKIIEMKKPEDALSQEDKNKI